MIISRQLRKDNIVGYLLYMWQVEDTIRAFGCDLSVIRREYIPRFELTDEQRDDMTDWYGNLVRMIREEGVTGQGHIQINKIIVQQLDELHAQLLSSPKFPFYSSQYYKVLPFIVELRNKGSKDISEIETCLNLVYGVTLLRLQNKEISPATSNAVKEVSTFLGMLSDYFKEDKEKGLQFDDDQVGRL